MRGEDGHVVSLSKEKFQRRMWNLKSQSVWPNWRESRLTHWIREVWIRERWNGAGKWEQCWGEQYEEEESQENEEWKKSACLVVEQRVESLESRFGSRTQLRGQGCFLKAQNQWWVTRIELMKYHSWKSETWISRFYFKKKNQKRNRISLFQVTIF